MNLLPRDLTTAGPQHLPSISEKHAPYDRIMFSEVQRRTCAENPANASMARRAFLISFTFRVGRSPYKYRSWCEVSGHRVKIQN
jgi:hypothetical protein